MQLSHGFSFTAKLAMLHGRLIRDIAETVPPAAADVRNDGTAHHCATRYCCASTLSSLTRWERAYTGLRDALPGTSPVQVIHVRDENSIRQTANVSAKVDAILLDSGQPSPCGSCAPFTSPMRRLGRSPIRLEGKPH